MSAAFALGAPEWWTGPGKTGVQLLESDAFAAEFVAKETTADVREIRRIVFQMLGLDHLLLFLGNCCCVENDEYAEVDVEAQAAKKSAFDEDNTSRMLYFALECGLDLGLDVYHKIEFELSNLQIELFGPNEFAATYAGSDTLNTVELLTKAHIRQVHVSGVVTRAVLACATFDATTTRLYTGDSGSAVWYDILDILFAHHQLEHLELSTVDILRDYCLDLLPVAFKFAAFIDADRHDKQRRMLPYLLSKADLSSGSIIVRFCHTSADFAYLIACAAVCGSHRQWSRTCVGLISLFAEHKEFIANVSSLPGLGYVKSQHDVVNYVLACLQWLGGSMIDVGDFSVGLMRVLVKADALTVDRFFRWVEADNKALRVSSVTVVFAAQMFLTQSITTRMDLYQRFCTVDLYRDRHVEIVYTLLLGKGSFVRNGCRSNCSIYLALDMLAQDLDIRAIEYVIEEAHARDAIRCFPSDHILELCERQLRFDLLLLLVKRHYHAHIRKTRALELIDELKTVTCYTDSQMQILMACVREHINV
ncbi:hypothetical protein JKY72_06010 [Candidatus Gracilibacteria bacterium]|nr:hypothetical protein [Candidatus Gracilibacteria bacterium]